MQLYNVFFLVNRVEANEFELGYKFYVHSTSFS